ncbi:MAG: ribosome maturation factor RimM [Bryobacteraceae bacterium]
MSSPEEGWVTVAVLGKTRGSRGEVTAFPLSDKPERYSALREVRLFRDGQERRFEVEEAWFHAGRLALKFRGVDTIGDAERLAGAEVRVPISERAPLEPGEFFQSDLLGCQVTDRRTGASLGRVAGWQDGGGSGLLRMEGGWLIPFVRAICVEIDPRAKRIVVDLPEGLEELNRP